MASAEQGSENSASQTISGWRALTSAARKCEATKCERENIEDQGTPCSSSCPAAADSAVQASTWAIPSSHQATIERQAVK